MATLYEKLEHIDSLNQHKRKVDQLKEAGDFVFKSIVQATYAKNINFRMPPGAPPFTKNEAGRKIEDKDLKVLARECLDFGKHQWNREKVFTQLLEIVNEKDAEILIAMKDKDLTTVFPTFTKKLLAEAFPELVR
jgi:hypothetical protein